MSLEPVAPRPSAWIVVVLAVVGLLTACSAGGATRRSGPAPAPSPTAPGQLAFAGSSDGASAAGPSGSGSAAGSNAASPAADTAPSTTSPYDVPSPDPLVESLAKQLTATPTPGSGPVALSIAQARCVSSAMLSRLGPDVLARLGATAADGSQLDLSTLDGAQREAFADAVVGCLDLHRLLVDQLSASLDLGDDVVACLVQRVERDGTLAEVVRRAVIDGSDPSASEDLLRGPMLSSLTACLSPEDIARLGRPH